MVGVLVVVATAIVLLLVAVILFVTACRKKSGNSFEHGVFSEEAVRIAHSKRVSCGLLRGGGGAGGGGRRAEGRSRCALVGTCQLARVR